MVVISPLPENPGNERIRVENRTGLTLRSVRKLKNLTHALAEISSKPVGADGIPFTAYEDPKGYLRWNPHLLDKYPELNPVRAIQLDLILVAFRIQPN